MSDPLDLSEKIIMNIDIAMCLWRALREEECSEADLLAAVIIGNGVEPIFEDADETLDFYREYLITEGIIEEVSATVQ